MKLKKIHINAFGKLDNFEMEFLSGQNVVFGRNEEGKSTLMAFIKAVFYGFPKYKKDIRENPRKKYTPWHKNQMGGSLEFETDKTDYRIEREFGSVPREDTLKIINLSSGTQKEIPSDKEPGDVFFNMSEETFSKSLFVGQIGSVISVEDTRKEDEIIKRLQNLASSGDETQSYNDVKKRIETASEKLISKSGKLGIIPDLEQKKKDLHEEKNVLLENEDRKAEVKDKLDGLLQEESEKLKKLDELKSKRDKLSGYTEYMKLKRLKRKADSTKNLGEELNRAKKLVEIKEGLANINEIDQMNEMLKEISSKESVVNEIENEIRKKTDELESLRKQTEDLITEKEYNRVNSFKDEIDDLTSKKNKLEDENEEISKLENVEKKLSEYTKQKKEINELIFVEYNICDEKRELLDKFSFPLLSIMLPVIICTLFILAGIFTMDVFAYNYIFFAPAALSLFFIPFYAVFHFSKKRKKKKEFEDAHRQAIQTERALSGNIQFVEREEKQALQEKQRIIKEIERIDDKAQYTEVIQDVKSSYEETKDLLEKRNKQLEEMFTRYEVTGINEFRGKYMSGTNVFNTEKLLNESIAREIENNKKRRTELAEEKEAFNRLADKYDIPVDFDEAVKELKDKRENYYIYMNLKSLYEEKSRSLEEELEGRKITDIEKKISEFEEKHSYESDNGSGTKDYAQKLEDIDKEIERTASEFENIKEEVFKIKTNAAFDFTCDREISTIEKELDQISRMLDHYRKEHDALECAKIKLTRAFEEMQKNFGPLVNKRTGEIFSEITLGKYKNLTVSKDFNIFVREKINDTTREWEYLSSGTVDQVYFSLRLAISELFSGEEKGLPLFLDDSFLQYDDERAKAAIEFMSDYSKNRNIQFFLFTCHESILDFVEDKDSILRLSK